MKIVNYAQGSPEWHAWRLEGIGASEMAMILGVSPFGSAQKLWELKTKRRAPEKDNPAMKKGRQDEPLALAAYEALTGHIMTNECAEHDEFPFIRASFDGITSAHDHALEIKNPGASVHKMVLNGEIPEYYNIQCHQQMLVADLNKIDFFSYFKEWPIESERGVLLEVVRSDILINKIIEAGKWFWNEHVLPDIPLYPEGWESAAAFWLRCKEEHERSELALEEAKLALVTLANGENKQGAGVSLTHSEREGGIDYKKFVADKGFDLTDIENYKKAGSKSIMVKKLTTGAKADEKEQKPLVESIKVTSENPKGDEEWNW